jgi:hypothetical protein
LPSGRDRRPAAVALMRRRAAVTGRLLLPLCHRRVAVSPPARLRFPLFHRRTAVTGRPAALALLRRRAAPDPTSNPRAHRATQTVGPQSNPDCPASPDPTPNPRAHHATQTVGPQSTRTAPLLLTPPPTRAHTTQPIPSARKQTRTARFPRPHLQPARTPRNPNRRPAINPDCPASPDPTSNPRAHRATQTIGPQAN